MRRLTANTRNSKEVDVTIMHRLRVAVLCCLGLTVAACGGGGTSSGGPTPHAGTYEGSVSVAGLGSLPLTVIIDAAGNIEFDVAGGGIVCSGDVPEDLRLDGDAFDASGSGECVVGGFPCPTTTQITGAVSGGAITGSGQVLLGCPAATPAFDFSFAAR